MSMFNSAFKTNPHMEQGMMTGITRVSKESIFSDLNNLEVVTTTSDKYATAFGFTEEVNLNKKTYSNWHFFVINLNDYIVWRNFHEKVY